MNTRKTAAVAALVLLAALCAPAHAGGGNPNDADGDGVLDDRDNCLLAPNPSQLDANGDGFGNACDMDLDDDGVVNAVDLGLLRAAFFTADPVADANGDGIVNAIDLGVLRQQFFGPPGPTRFVSRAAAGGAWSDASAWRPARVPQPEDHVLIQGNPWSSVELDVNATVATFEIGGGALFSNHTLEAVQSFVVTPGQSAVIDDASIIAGERVLVGGNLSLAFASLTLAAGEFSLFAVGNGAILDADGSMLQIPAGIDNMGTMNLSGCTGTLGAISTANGGSTFFAGNTLRLTGTHTGTYVEGTDNVFTLAGSVVGTSNSLQLTLSDDAWAFEPGALIRDASVNAQAYTLTTPGTVRFVGGALSGELNVAPASTVELAGTAILGDVTLLAPTTVQQGAPALRFIGLAGFGTFVDGFGRVRVAPSALAGLMPAAIVFDAPGEEFVVAQSLTFDLFRSTDIAMTDSTQLRLASTLNADASLSNASTLRIDGHWFNEGPMDIRNGFTAELGGDWANLPPAGRIHGTNASLNLLGAWTNDGEITVTDGSVDFGSLDVNSPGDVMLTRSVARATGELAGDVLGQVVSDSESLFEFGGTLSSSTAVLDLDDLPTGFAVGPGALLDLVEVRGSGPLLATGGRLDRLTLSTDLHILNGATVAATGAFLIDSDIVLLADDATTTLLIPDDGFGGIGGEGDIVFAGSTLDDAHNTVRTQGQSIGGMLPVRIRAATTGGRIIGEDTPGAFSTSLFADLLVEAEDRTVSIESSLPVLLDGDLSLAEGSTLALDVADSTTLLGDLGLAAGSVLGLAGDVTLASGGGAGPLWSTVLDPVLGSGRIEALPGAAPSFSYDGATLALTFGSGFTPMECAEFVLGVDALFSGELDAVDASALAPFDVRVDNDVSFLSATLLGPSCP